MDNPNGGLWDFAPESVLLHIFSYLGAKDITVAGCVCKSWHRIGEDELIWKHLLYRDFHVNPSIPRTPGANSWLKEYKRLKNDIPMVMTERLESHFNQVLHVAFSHDGTMFSTASKDGNIIVWDSDYPCRLKYKQDMTEFRWKHTQFSQFNASDTLLLVSGIHFGSPHNTSGEIAVFTVQNEFLLQCRVVNKPYDVFGCWIGEQHLLSGELHWLAHLTSLSTLWINKASQEPESEHIPVITQLYKFYNPSASSIRSVMVAECKWPESPVSSHPQTSESTMNHMPAEQNDNFSIVYDPVYRQSELRLEEQNEEIETLSSSTNDSESSSRDDLMDHKILIFTSGKDTYTPHQLGFKHIMNLHFPKHLAPGPPIQERLAARQRERERERDGEEVDWTNYESVKYMFDEPDKVIDLQGHIIGMALSPDHRYLYVNSRPWPAEYSIVSPLQPPPIAHQMSLHVIDLRTLALVGRLHRLPLYAQNNKCFFIFLDVSHTLVASGCEDNAAYIWDRHYGIGLARLPHGDVVNAVAFNPADDHMCVTTSDDYSIKVWRSKSSVKKLGLSGRGQPEAVRLHTAQPCPTCHP